MNSLTSIFGIPSNDKATLVRRVVSTSTVESTKSSSPVSCSSTSMFTVSPVHTFHHIPSLSLPEPPLQLDQHSFKNNQSSLQETVSITTWLKLVKTVSVLASTTLTKFS